MITLGDSANGDRGRFRVLSGFGGIALFDADFRNFVFAPHFHDTLMIGLICEGQKRFIRDREAHEVGAGGLSIVNPGDTHSGGVIGNNRPLRYTAVYPSAVLIAEAGLPPGADLGPAVVDDPALWSVFANALSLDTPGSEAEEALLIALMGLASRYVAAPARLPMPATRPVMLAVDFIRAELSAELRLENIADEVGVSRRHLIRCFHRSMGMTPQEYVRQARVHEAAGRLRRGESPALAAQAVGFADQAHMTRAFRKVMGIPPAAYARSWRK